MLIALVWAAAAPVLLLLPIGALGMVLRRYGWASAKTSRWVSFGSAAAMVIAAVAAVYVPQRMEFERFCEEMGPPTVMQTASAEGFFLDDSTANSFGMRYLHEEGYKWLEARSIYNRKRFTRYEMVDGKIQQQEVEQLSAKYKVGSVGSTRPGGVYVTWQTISSMEDDKVMARAGQARFDGGAMQPVMGAWGMASCPNPITMKGSSEFNTYYHLARKTLIPGK